MHYFSPSTGGFYDDETHGARLIAAQNFTGEGDAPLIPNPDTKIPSDVVEVTDEEKTALFAAQADGKIIIAGEDGKPVAVAQPLLPPEQLLGNMRATRNNLLASSDWTQVADAPLTNVQKAEWALYRKALRDLPETADPMAITWPQAPA